MRKTTTGSWRCCAVCQVGVRRSSMIPTRTTGRGRAEQAALVPCAGNRPRSDDAPRREPVGPGGERTRGAALECGGLARVGSNHAKCGVVPRSRTGRTVRRRASSRGAGRAPVRSGMTASDASPDGVRVAQMLRSAIVPVGEEEAERHPAAKLLIDAIEDTRREVRTGVRQPAWKIAWQVVQRTESDPIRPGATADVIAPGYPGDVEELAVDPRDPMRVQSQPSPDGSERCGLSGWNAGVKRGTWTRSRDERPRDRSSRE